jgi:hypothetical protein
MTMTAEILPTTELRTVIKLVKPPIMPRLARQVDFDLTDADEWGRYARVARRWQVTVAHATTISDLKVEVVAAIAAPDGRVAVWYGQAVGFSGTTPREKNLRDTTDYWAARAAIDCEAVAAMWDVRRTRGGDRDIGPLAMAAGRVLHAQVFGDVPAPRDLLLAEFVLLTGADRPDTSMLLRASDDALMAAGALVAIKNYRGAQALLAGKGVCGS